MIYTPMTVLAMNIAYDAHHGAYDGNGVPYIFHPYHLAEQMDDEDSAIVALLHDVVEDTCITLDYLKEKGFSDEVIDALGLLVRKEGEDYMDYIDRVKTNHLATVVKLADLRHNSDKTRFCRDMTDYEKERIKKYGEAISRLTEGNTARD